MDSIKAKISYIHGLMDGLSINDKTKEGRVLSEILNVLGDIGDRIESLEDRETEIEMYLDVLNGDLQDLEEDYDEYEYLDEGINEDDFSEVQCINCDETIYVDKSIIENDEHLKCPNCNCDIINSSNEKFND